MFFQTKDIKANKLSDIFLQILIIAIWVIKYGINIATKVLVIKGTYNESIPYIFYRFAKQKNLFFDLLGTTGFDSKVS